MAGSLKSGRRSSSRNKTAGELRERVRIEKLADTPERDESGAEVEVWEEVATVWASVDPVSGVEFFASGQVQARATHTVVMRRRTDVTPKNRLVWTTNRDLVLAIKAVDESKDRGDSLEITCVREV